jgi:hypothetical protein
MYKILTCIVAASACLYACIDGQNKLTELRLRLPERAREVQCLKEENMRLRYEVERFESPEHLMTLARLPAFNHLRYPLVKEVWTLAEGVAVQSPAVEETRVAAAKSKLNVVIGATQ